ncbi:MAG: cobaltochelatase subunit CobN [Halobacteriota archaeon]
MQKGRPKRNYIGLLVAAIFVMQIFALPVFGTEIEKSVDKASAKLDESIAYAAMPALAQEGNNTTILFFTNNTLLEQTFRNLTAYNISCRNILPEKLSNGTTSEYANQRINDSEIIFLDISNETLISYINDSIINSSAKTIGITNLSFKYNNINDTVLSNITEYWGLSEENLRRMSIYIAHELDDRTDLNVEEPLRTTMLILAGHNAYIKILREIDMSDYNIYCRVFHFSDYYTRENTDAVKEMIDEENEIILEGAITSPPVAVVEDEIWNASERGVKVIIIVGGITQGKYYGSYNSDNTTVINEVIDYWNNPMEVNTKRMLIYMAYNLDNRTDLEEYIKPYIKAPTNAIYHPGAPNIPYEDAYIEHTFLNVTAYFEWYHESGRYDPEKPTIGVLMPDDLYFDTTIPDDIIESIEDQGYNAFPCYTHYYGDPIGHFFHADNKTWVDVIISLRTFQMRNGVETLSEMDTPFLKGVTLYSAQTINEWRNSLFGVSSTQICWQFDMPEMDGAIVPIVVGGIQSKEDINRYSIEERVDKLVNT